MRIAFVYDCAYPWVKGGAEKRIYEIGKRLANNGHEVHFFTLKWWDGENHINKDGIHYHGIGKSVQIYKNGKRSILEALYFGLKILTSFRGDFDIIDCQEFPYFSCFSAKIHSSISKSKFFITWYEIWGDYWFEYLGKKGLFGVFIEKLVSKIHHVPITISEKIKDDLIHMGVSGAPIHVLHNGVDFYNIEKVIPSDQKLDLIYVGRLIEHKNVDVLLKAIHILQNKIPNIRCGIIGDGPEKDSLLKLSEKLGISDNVIFFGFLEEDEEVYSYMKASKIFILPSTREGFPNTILEANSCGLPVIIVNHEKNAGIWVVKEGYNGFVVNLSPEEIAEVVANLLEKDISKLKMNALEFAKNHDWSVIVNQIEKIYKESL